MMTLEQGRTDGYEGLRWDQADKARRLLSEGIIRVDFNGFFDLPLKTPVIGKSFVDCPVGIVVTEKRLWLAHLPFKDGPGQVDLWPQYKVIDSSPKHVLAFGGNGVRLSRLMVEMKRVTGMEVDGSIILPETFELYELHVKQENDKLSIKFQEIAYPQNSLKADLSL